MSKPAASLVRRVAALGFTPTRVRRYIAAMQKTPSGKSAGDTGASFMHTEYAGIDFSPPPEVREAAVEALERRFRDGHAGGTDIGVGRALQLALEDTVPPRDIDRMVNYGTRHRVDLRSARAQAGEMTPGVVAWGLWGGHDGIRWAQQVASAMRARGNVHKRARRAPPTRANRSAPRAPRVTTTFTDAELDRYATESDLMPIGWRREMASLLGMVQGIGIPFSARAIAPGAPLYQMLMMGLVDVEAQHTAKSLLLGEGQPDVVDIVATKKGRALYPKLLAWRKFDEARRAPPQIGLFGNPAPGYQSWAWTTQDWRVIVPHADGSVSYDEACGAPSNRTLRGHVRLCLPFAVAHALDRDAEGRRILHAQAVKKQRAGKGAVVRWHPVIRELWRAVEARTPTDDARYRRRP
jgi:hypothetical protein